MGYQKVKQFESMFIRFDTIHERERRTNRQTDRQTQHDSIIGRPVHSVVRQKKITETNQTFLKCVNNTKGKCITTTLQQITVLHCPRIDVHAHCLHYYVLSCDELK